MQSAALQRAKNLMTARSGSVVAIRALSVLEALLALSLVVVAGLLLGLVETRGVTRLTSRHMEGAEFQQLPRWLRAGLPSVEALRRAPVSVPNTGLYALAAAGRFSPYPWQRLGAGALGRVVTAFRPSQNNLGALQSLLILGLLLLLAVSYAGRARRSLAAGAAGNAARALRNQIHRQMYRLGHSALPTEGAGPILNLFTRDVNEIRDGLVADIETTLRAPVLAAGLLAIALFLSPIQTLFLLSLGGLVWVVSIPLASARKEEADAAARESAVYLLLLHEDLGMIRTVRVFGMEGVDKRRFEEHLDQYQQSDNRRIRAEARRDPTALLMAGAAAFLAAGVLGHNILIGAINSATAILLLASLIGLSRPVARWLERRQMLAQASRAAEAIERFMERKPELQMGVNAQFLPPIRERISFENVTLESPSGKPLLVGVSAEVPARTRTAIMGFDEEAKHALVCLVPRLIDPKVGRVRIDGVDLREVTLESLRAQVALILQADLVFSDSVLNNIGLGDESFGLAKIIEAAKLAHAHQFIQELPKGYETVIGPLGHPLSPDQEFRIALARAFLHDPSIVILEEPTAPLDDEIKPLIDDTIDRLAPGRTMIFLPHRLSTIRKCEQVIVLHNGRVESSGPPRDVHGKSKLYRHLQYVEFNQFATGEIEAGQMG